MVATSTPSNTSTTTSNIIVAPVAPASASSNAPVLAIDNGFVPAIMANAAGAVESNYSLFLGGKNADLAQQLPASSRLMTLLISAEQLSPDALIPVSEIAVTSDSQHTTPDKITLKAGSNYTVRYLQLRLLTYNDNASAYALAERIGGSVTKFIEMMNHKAKSLGLTSTTFNSPSGQAINPDQAATLKPFATTTIKDLLLIASSCRNNQTLWNYFQTKISYPSVNGTEVAAVKASTSEILALGDGMVRGVYHFNSDLGSTTISFSQNNKLSLITVINSAEKSLLTQDSLNFISQVSLYYDATILATANSLYSGQTDVTKDGTRFNLVFHKEISYIHPKTDSFASSSIRYESYGPLPLPLSDQTPAGRVIFSLKNGQTISSTVFPETTIYADNSTFISLIRLLNNNHNLYVIVMFLMGILLFAVSLAISRTLYQIVLVQREIKLNRGS